MKPILLAICLAGCGGLPAVPGQKTPSGTHTLTVTPFTVDAGKERYVCQNFANPFGGSDAVVTRFASHLGAGAHHMLVFYQPGASNDAEEDCSGTEFAAGPYGSQRMEDSVDYPSGVGARVAAGTGFRVQAHFLNATMQPLTATVSVDMTVAADSLSLQAAAVLFMSNSNVDLPANTDNVTAHKSCTLPFDVKIIQATSHMHSHGIGFVATSGTQTLFTTTDWTDVTPAFFDPPISLSAGSDVDFTCTYDNDTPNEITYGDSAATNEMCIFSAQFYPAPLGGWSCL